MKIINLICLVSILILSCNRHSNDFAYFGKENIEYNYYSAPDGNFVKVIFGDGYDNDGERRLLIYNSKHRMTIFISEIHFFTITYTKIV